MARQYQCISYRSDLYQGALARINNQRRAKGKRFVATNSKKANRAVLTYLMTSCGIENPAIVSPRDEDAGRYVWM